MRLTADLDTVGSSIPLVDAEGAVCGQLWTHAATWACRDAPLSFRLLGPEELQMPEPEPTEPVVGALARLLQTVKGTGAVVLLANPAQALGPQRILFAEGARLFSIARPEDEACWDAMLSQGQPVYGVRGIVSMEVMRPTAPAAISALVYGLFTCDEGLSLTGLHEDRAGVIYACDRPTTAAVIIRHGFEGGTLRGEAGAQVAYRDRGNEAYVRLVISDAAGNRCSTQPRFIVPQRTGVPQPPSVPHHG
jgi:hypothetical protein